ncbi:TPA: hypothetical protein ACITDB_004746 [Salmonella enterica subsp. enterica serovar Saintpaul]
MKNISSTWFTTQRAPTGAGHLSILQQGALKAAPFFYPVLYSKVLIMKVVVRSILLISAMIVFTFKRADVANRPDYIEEDSVF